MGEEQFGKLGEEEDEDGEPAIKRRREYTVFGFDLGEREEQVVCHASALALAMTDEARRDCGVIEPSDRKAKLHRQNMRLSETYREISL